MEYTNKVMHSVVKPGIASKLYAKRFLWNFHAKIASGILSCPQLNPKYTLFGDIWDFEICDLLFFSFFLFHPADQQGIT